MTCSYACGRGIGPDTILAEGVHTIRRAGHSACIAGVVAPLSWSANAGCQELGVLRGSRRPHRTTSCRGTSPTDCAPSTTQAGHDGGARVVLGTVTCASAQGTCGDGADAVVVCGCIAPHSIAQCWRSTHTHSPTGIGCVAPGAVLAYRIDTFWGAWTKLEVAAASIAGVVASLAVSTKGTGGRLGIEGRGRQALAASLVDTPALRLLPGSK